MKSRIADLLIVTLAYHQVGRILGGGLYQVNTKELILYNLKISNICCSAV
jgi:hypothetical protein